MKSHLSCCCCYFNFLFYFFFIFLYITIIYSFLIFSGNLHLNLFRNLSILLGYCWLTNNTFAHGTHQQQVLHRFFFFFGFFFFFAYLQIIFFAARLKIQEVLCIEYCLWCFFFRITFILHFSLKSTPKQQCKVCIWYVIYIVYNE